MITSERVLPAQLEERSIEKAIRFVRATPAFTLASILLTLLNLSTRIKYDVKKIEEVVYDVSLRNLRKV